MFQMDRVDDTGVYDEIVILISCHIKLLTWYILLHCSIESALMTNNILTRRNVALFMDCCNQHGSFLETRLINIRPVSTWFTHDSTFVVRLSVFFFVMASFLLRTFKTECSKELISAVVCAFCSNIMYVLVPKNLWQKVGSCNGYIDEPTIEEYSTIALVHESVPYV